MEEAFVMQQAAANQNHPDALFDTAVMLLKGHGVTKNVSFYFIVPFSDAS